MWFKNSKKMEKLNRKKFQTHMCNFLFGDSVLALNYKYYQVTSSAKTFSNSFYSWRCRSKEYPPKSTPIWGYSPKFPFERICRETITINYIRLLRGFFICPTWWLYSYVLAQSQIFCQLSLTWNSATSKNVNFR